MRDADFELEAELEELMSVLLESDLESEAESEAPACDNKGLPTPSRAISRLSSGRIQCPAAGRWGILDVVINNAVQMLDNTIAELTRARQAACEGRPLGWPNLSDVTACWLKYKLGVCIDDPSTWTAGTFQSSTVAEVIRRLVKPRELLASGEILYVCEETCNPETLFAFTFPMLSGRCNAGTPDRTIHLCPRFWSAEHAPFREQTIIHEAVHLTHCGEHRPDTIGIGVSIGSPECLAQFVAANNGKKLDPTTVGQCGFTNRCGTVPRDAIRRNCGGIVGRPGGLPDWRP